MLSPCLCFPTRPRLHRPFHANKLRKVTIGKGRLEAFSDGVIAILITIMVLELRCRTARTSKRSRSSGPVLMSYVLSYLYCRHLLEQPSPPHARGDRISGSVLWANLHLLFWLSLIPFTTRWMEEAEFASLPVAMYGVVLFLAGFAYYILEKRLLAANPKDSAASPSGRRQLQGKPRPSSFTRSRWASRSSSRWWLTRST